MGNESLRSGMLRVFVANVISLVFSLLTNFILPKYLSVDSYAGIKTFQLYIVYIGIMHFGYEDGMYLKYGGKHISEISSADITKNMFTLRIFQSTISALMVIVSVVLGNYILLAFSLAIVPVNLVAYYKLLFQAVGEFKRYGHIMNLTSVVTFAINAILVFIIKTDRYLLFIGCYVVWDIVLWLILESYLKGIIILDKESKHFSFIEMKSNISTGLPLTLGNFSSVLLTSIDRWFVKYLLPTLAFAEYSFSVSTESFINVALTPITVTLYNYFCNHKNPEDILKIRNTVMIFASYVVSCAFGAKLIIQWFIPKYEGSILVMFILFASQICYVTIKGVYVNIYKAQGRQKEYFLKLLLVVVFGVVANAIFFKVHSTKEAFALATLCSSFFWLCLCLRDFPELHLNIAGWIYMIMSVLSFILCGAFLHSVIGFVVYILLLMILGRLLMSAEQKYLISVAKSYINGVISKLKIKA